MTTGARPSNVSGTHSGVNSSGASGANGRGGWASWLGGGLLVGLGAAGLVFGGLPLWAARRILYPTRPEPLPHAGEGALDLEIDVAARPERVQVAARDGKTLSGWFLPGPHESDAPWPCVVLLYGYGGYKEQMAGYAQMVHHGGFAALMFDTCGSGARLGEPVSLGYKERWDLMDAVHYVQTRPDVDPERIGVLGISMGGVAAILAAGDDPNIKAVVADSAFADLTEMVKPGIKAFLGLPPFPFAPLIVRYAETMLGMKTDEIVPERAASHFGERPLFIIHGEDDSLVHAESAHRLYAAASGPKELWVVPNCEHAQAPVVAAEEYRNRVNGFFSRWLGS